MASGKPQNASSTRHFIAALALVLACLALIAGLLFMLATPLGPSPVEAGVNAYLVEWMGTDVNHVGQREGYLLALVLITLSCASGKWIANFAEKRAAPAISTLTCKLISAISPAAVCLIAGSRCFTHPLSGVIGFLSLPIIYRWHRLLTRRSLRGFYKLVILCVLLFVLLPGMFCVPDLSLHSGDSIVEIQSHYSVILGPGDRLARGDRLFDTVHPKYGLALPVISAVITKLCGPISMGSYVVAIRCLQVCFLLAAAFLYCQHARGISFASTTAIFFFAPIMQLSQNSEYFPNHTPWRLLTFPIALLALFLVRKLPQKMMAASLGCVASLLILLNVEAGVASTLGLLMFLILIDQNQKEVRQLRLRLVVFLSCLFGAWVFLYVAASTVAGYWPNLFVFIDDIRQRSALVKAGYYGGDALKFWVLPFLMFMQATYFLIKSRLVNCLKTSFQNVFRTAVACILLVWLSYFVNRPNTSYLFALLFLYGFFLIDLLRAMFVALRRRKALSEPAILLITTFCLLVLPSIIESYGEAWGNFTRCANELMHGPGDKDARLISGVYLQKEVAQVLENKAALVRSESQKPGSIIYMTLDSFLLPRLSNYYSPPGLDDIFANLILRQQSVDFVSRIATENPRLILIDEAGSHKFDRPVWNKCLEALRSLLLTKGYSIQEVRSGWQIWSRQPNVLPGSAGVSPASSGPEQTPNLRGR